MSDGIIVSRDRAFRDALKRVSENNQAVSGVFERIRWINPDESGALDQLKAL